MSTDFVTFDFETTGLLSKQDRVIEIGVVRTSPSGQVIAEFGSLVNPNRDVGPTWLHGINAGMLAKAPSFEEIAGHIAEIMNGGILVAHNAKFDTRFLNAELQRSKRSFDSLDALCTLEMMYAAYPRSGRKLLDCCDTTGVEIRNAHSALDDARMASDLLHHLLTKIDIDGFISPVWIDPLPKSTTNLCPRNIVHNPREQEASFLASLISKLPEIENLGFTSAASVAEYFNLLDLVLEDRRIDPNEAEELAEVAADLRLSAERVQGLHGAYVANLCALAKEDHIVSDAERQDLSQVATLLSVSDWEDLLIVTHAPRTRPVSRSNSGLEPGFKICFTGDMSIPRSQLSEMSEAKGLQVMTGVSKKLDALVVADTDSMSGKAKKAREYGTRILTETVFLKMLAEMA